MDWFAPIDMYCERTHHGIISEPINFATNMSFLIAAIVMWYRAKTIKACRILSMMLASIGIASALHHSFAQTWAALIDVLSIAVFVFTYLFLANRNYLGLSVKHSIIIMILFLPINFISSNYLLDFDFLGDSAGYMPILFLTGAYALILRNKLPKVSNGLLIGFYALAISLAFRTVDQTFCSQWPVGTHFMWHIVNAITLAWVIEVYYQSKQGKISNRKSCPVF